MAFARPHQVAFERPYPPWSPHDSEASGLMEICEVALFAIDIGPYWRSHPAVGKRQEDDMRGLRAGAVLALALAGTLAAGYA